MQSYDATYDTNYWYPKYRVTYNNGDIKDIISNMSFTDGRIRIHKCTCVDRRIIDVVYRHESQGNFDDYVRQDIYSISAYTGTVISTAQGSITDNTSYTQAFKNYKSAVTGTWSVERRGKLTNVGYKGVAGETWSSEYYNAGSANNRKLKKQSDTTVDLCEYIWIDVNRGGTYGHAPFVEPIVTRLTLDGVGNVTSITNAPNTVTEQIWNYDFPWIS